MHKNEVKRSAIVSDCDQFRYRLDRSWSLNERVRNPINFVMLNPSKADGSVDDPTIRKCMGFAMRLGFNQLRVVNLFAYRATDPRDLKNNGYQGGPENGFWLRDVGEDSARTNPHEPVVLAWGANARDGQAAYAAAQALRILLERGAHLFTLRTLADGTPAHPLMLPYSCVLTPWEK